MAHLGDYLERRQGVGRQCWSGCDRTPCTCPRDVRRALRRPERQRARAEAQAEADDLRIEARCCRYGYCGACKVRGPYDPDA